MAIQTITDVVSAALKYEGSAALGTDTSAPAWSLKRTTVSSGVTTVDYPIGVGKIPTDSSSFSWDGRAAYKYGLVPDTAAPVLSSAARVSDTVVDVTLSDVMLASSVTKSNDGGFIVKDAAVPATAYAVSAIAPGATQDIVRLTVASFAASAGNGLKVTYSNSGNGTACDQVGNALATDAAGVTVALWDAHPTMDSAERLANTTVRVTLSEVCDTATTTKANAGGFVVYEIGSPATTYAVSAIAPNGGNHDQVDLTVADMGASAAVGVTVTYVAGGNGTVADDLGNLMATDATGVNATAWA